MDISYKKVNKSEYCSVFKNLETEKIWTSIFVKMRKKFDKHEKDSGWNKLKWESSKLLVSRIDFLRVILS